MITRTASHGDQGQEHARGEITYSRIGSLAYLRYVKKATMSVAGRVRERERE